MNRFLAAALVMSACGAQPTGESLPDPQLPPQMVVSSGADAGAAGGGAGAAGGGAGATGGGAVAAGGGAGATGGGAGATQYAYPSWVREDIQPASPQHAQMYGLEQFRGRTVVVMLLEGFCTFCRGNVVVAEQLQTTLRAERRDVEIVVLSDANASDFVSRTGLRIFRDAQPGRPAWVEMRPMPSKHDTFVFAPNGERTYFWQGSYTGDATRWTADVGQAVRAVAPVQ